MMELAGWSYANMAAPRRLLEGMLSHPKLAFIDWKSRPLIWLEEGSGWVGGQEGQGREPEVVSYWR